MGSRHSRWISLPPLWLYPISKYRKNSFSIKKYIENYSLWALSSKSSTVFTGLNVAEGTSTKIEFQ